MKQRIGILILLVALLCGCATSRKLTKQPAWQTANVSNCTATVTMDSMAYTIGCAMQVMRDSLVIISLRPMMNIEIGRLEITPGQALAIDKINHQYTAVELTKTLPLVPKIRWNDLQAFAAAEKAQKGDSVTLNYAYKGHLLRLNLTYGDIAYDAPILIRRLNVDKYKYVDTFLPE